MCVCVCECGVCGVCVCVCVVCECGVSVCIGFKCFEIVDLPGARTCPRDALASVFVF